MASGRKTGGRKKGTPNRSTAARREAVRGSGLTSLEYLQSLYRNEALETALRLEAARAAAPYEYPRMASMQHEISRAITLEMLVAASMKGQA